MEGRDAYTNKAKNQEDRRRELIEKKIEIWNKNLPNEKELYGKNARKIKSIPYKKRIKSKNKKPTYKA